MQFCGVAIKAKKKKKSTAIRKDFLHTAHSNWDNSYDAPIVYGYWYKFSIYKTEIFLVPKSQSSKYFKGTEWPEVYFHSGEQS